MESPPSPELPVDQETPFVYISAEDIFRPFVSSRYISTKREAEKIIATEALLAERKIRPVFIRPSTCSFDQSCRYPLLTACFRRSHLPSYAESTQYCSSYGTVTFIAHSVCAPLAAQTLIYLPSDSQRLGPYPTCDELASIAVDNPSHPRGHHC